MSITSNRMALEPIKGSILNSSSNSDLSSSINGGGIKKKKLSPRSRIRLVTVSPSLALAPSNKAGRSLSFASATSTSTASIAHLNSRRFPSASKMASFSDFRSTSSTNNSPGFTRHSSTTTTATTTTVFKNDTAGLAATKLKLKLQLALYKLQQRDELITKRKHPNLSGNSITSSTTSCSTMEPPDFSISSSTSIKPLSPSFASFNSPSPTPVSRQSSYLPTPPETSSYHSSINVNLNNLSTAKKSITSSNSKQISLSNIAYKKQFNANNKKIQKLKLFQIKKNSIFYTNSKSSQLDHQKLLPKLKPTHDDDQVDDVKHASRSQTKDPSVSFLKSFSENSFVLPFAASSIPSIQVSSYDNVAQSSTTHNNNATTLPSISKILKTPLRKANFTRYNNATTSTSTTTTNNFNFNDDTTIDEDNETILNTTSNTISIMSNSKNSADGSLLSANNTTNTSTQTTNMKSSNKNILTSSPIANNFATPNSFSVAKSLLQLGGYV